MEINQHALGDRFPPICAKLSCPTILRRHWDNLCCMGWTTDIHSATYSCAPLDEISLNPYEYELRWCSEAPSVERILWQSSEMWYVRISFITEILKLNRTCVGKWVQSMGTEESGRRRNVARKKWGDWKNWLLRTWRQQTSLQWAASTRRLVSKGHFRREQDSWIWTHTEVGGTVWERQIYIHEKVSNFWSRKVLQV